MRMREFDRTKLCPYCGEEIKAVAIRCKHCHTDLSNTLDDDFNRGADVAPADDFERRFLEFAYESDLPINVPSVAYALKLPTAEVAERLEDLALRDVLSREIDDQGNVYFTLAGRPVRPPPTALARRDAHSIARAQSATLVGPEPPSESTAVAAMVLNVIIPGTGSLVAGRLSVGLMQLMLWVIGAPLSLLLIGLPLATATWIWSLLTGIKILEEAKQRRSP